MKVTVIGGTGFIGNYIVTNLLERGIDVIVTGTDRQKASNYPWFDKVNFFELDINTNQTEEILKEISYSDKVIHLAWSGLPNYNDLFHFEVNLFPQYSFLKKLISIGVNDITITGTCFEYGMVEGPLNTGMITDPKNPYAIAKDTLHKFLLELQKKETFKLKWLRLFYMYGNGQSEKSILSQLEQALKKGDKVFNMSKGEQIRDYLPVEEVAKLIINAVFNNEKDGVLNICSGQPITIKKLVEDYLKENKKKIKLNLGYYPYPDYEPMSFWGV